MPSHCRTVGGIGWISGHLIDGWARFTVDRIDQAYEVFGDANSALEVVITPA